MILSIEKNAIIKNIIFKKCYHKKKSFGSNAMFTSEGLFFVDDSMINMLYFFYSMMLCSNPWQASSNRVMTSSKSPMSP